VAAPLGEDLVFEVEARGAGVVVFDDGPADHLLFAEPGVGVGDDGEADPRATSRTTRVKWSRVSSPTSGTPAATEVAPPET
jgi:hypothetical protein